MKQAKGRNRLLCVLAGIVLVSLLFSMTLASAGGPSGNGDSTIIVSLGDSYSSGEGNEDFYGYDPSSVLNTIQSEDWLAHRSEKAWAGLLTLPGVDGRMRTHRYVPGEENTNGVNWYFVAASGATTDNINTSADNGKQNRNYYRRDGTELYFGTTALPGQLDVFYDTPGLDREEVDYVTITIGGNDVGFFSMMVDAVNPLSGELFDRINTELDTFYDEGGTRDKLYNAYHRIEEAAPNATIIVAGYPELFSYSGSTLGFISRNEADFINSSVREFNRRIWKIVVECRKEGMKIEFVDVEAAFKGHQAYTKEPYIYKIYLAAQEQDCCSNEVSRYSLHPNKSGQKKYAEAVQARINDLERKKTQTRDTSEVKNIVLVLDSSAGTEENVLTEIRQAAGAFIDSMLAEDAAIGIVSYSTYANMKTDFSRNADYLKSAVDSIYADSRANIYAGLELAEEMLDGTDTSDKIIVLADIDPADEGLLGEELLEYCESLRGKGITVYTLGGCELSGEEQVTRFFDDTADRINGISDRPEPAVPAETPVPAETSEKKAAVWPRIVFPSVAAVVIAATLTIILVKKRKAGKK